MRRVVITGSAGHLGRALRTAFVKHGYHVTGIDLQNADILADLEKTHAPRLPAGPYDTVICNAKVDSWRAHFALARLAQSSIVNIGSIYGALGSDPKLYEGTGVEETPASYVAAKGALMALTRHQATTMAPVRANCVMPGGIFRGHNTEFVTRYKRKVPLNRMATEEDIVPLVLFLAGEQSSYITGQCIFVDGGLSARA